MKNKFISICCRTWL